MNSISFDQIFVRDWVMFSGLSKRSYRSSGGLAVAE